MQMLSFTKYGVGRGLAGRVCILGWGRQGLVASLLTGAVLASVPAAHAAMVKVEGVVVEPVATVAGNRLVLNGAALRKRGYFKANVVALYLPERLTVPDSVYRASGAKRIQLHVLRDFTSSTISRMFISDFQKTATEAEFKQLIDTVAEIGSIYAEVKRVAPGDVVNIDWVPGKGIVTTFNDRPLGTRPIPSELAYQIFLRMFIGPDASADLRNGLLGLTRQTE
ncbi:hypothetical protein JY96_13465 [Aquabacterium sp. NJ1]|nr:hypothetical protein JY96_13465 [Aquabacterium sp. NJ1]